MPVDGHETPNVEMPCLPPHATLTRGIFACVTTSATPVDHRRHVDHQWFEL